MIALALHEALWSIRTQPIRSLSTVISVACAACSVLFCAAIIAGFDIVLAEMNFGASANAVTVRPNPLTNGRTGPPTENDAVIASGIGNVVARAMWVQGETAVQVAADTVVIPVFGADGDYRRELSTTLLAGRWPTMVEMIDGRTCLVGEQLFERIGRPRPGQPLRLGGVSCIVAGVMAYPSSRPARRFTDALVMPMPLVRRYFASEATRPRELAWFTLFFDGAEEAQTAREKVDVVLRRLHGVPQSRLSPFLYDDPDAQTRDQQRQREMMARLLFSVSGITLMVSILSYSTVMIASCRSRSREFAIRMAMGAFRRDIALQVMIENAILTLVGSTTGLIAGAALARVASARWGWTTATNWVLVGTVVLGGAAIGIMIGAYNARTAGRTPPALAAR